MVRQNQLKLCYDTVTGESQLFDLGEDPAELLDLSDREPERASTLEKHLEAFMATAIEGEQIAEPTGELREQLEELGYLR